MIQYRINKDIEIITQTVTNVQTLYASQTGECKYSGGSYGYREEFDYYGCDTGGFDDSLQAQVLPNGSHELSTGGQIWVDWVAIYHNAEEIENPFYNKFNSKGFHKSVTDEEYDKP